MNDLTVVLATLTDAIESYQSRVARLAPIEKLKLKALQLNLAAVQGLANPLCAAPARQTATLEEATARDTLGEKLRGLQASAMKTRDENLALVAETRHQVARAKSLCAAIRLTVEHG